MHVLRSSPSLAAAMHPSLRARASSSPSQVCAVSFFIGPGAMGTGRAVVRVVTVRGWRNWRMLGLHPGETLITLLPTFCCSVPRGVFFFFFFRFAGRCVPHLGGTFCRSLSKEGLFFILGGWGGLCGKFSFSTFSSLAAGNLFISLGAFPVARTTQFRRPVPLAA